MENYKQVCIWPGVTLEGHTKEDFEAFMLEEFKVRVKYLECVITNPDRDTQGNSIPETGGRSDLFFKVHTEDIPSFAVPRLSAGIRWAEDVLYYNDSKGIYSKEIFDKYPKTW